MIPYPTSAVAKPKKPAKSQVKPSALRPKKKPSRPTFELGEMYQELLDFIGTREVSYKQLERVFGYCWGRLETLQALGIVERYPVYAGSRPYYKYYVKN